MSSGKSDKEDVLREFINLILKDECIEDIDSDQIYDILNFDKDHGWSKRLFILGWWLLNNDKEQRKNSEFTDAVMNPEKGIFGKFRESIEYYCNTGRFDEETNIRGRKNFRNLPSDLKKAGLLLKEGKNYKLTDVGRKCAYYIFYRLLKIELKGLLFKIITSPSENNIRKIIAESYTDISEERLRDLFVLEDGTGLSAYFEELANFLGRYPILYHEKKRSLSVTLLRLLLHGISSEIGDDWDHLAVTRPKIDTDGYKEPEWVYIPELIIKDKNNRKRKIEPGGKIFDNKDEKILILKGSHGTGKSIFVIQRTLGFLIGTLNRLSDRNKNNTGESKGSERNILPIRLKCSRFTYERRDGRVILYYNGTELPSVSIDDNDSIIKKLLKGSLADYIELEDISVSIYYGAVKSFTKYILLDGWDETGITLRKFLAEYIIKLSESGEIGIIITTTSTDPYLGKIGEKIGNKKVMVASPAPMRKSDIEKYIKNRVGDADFDKFETAAEKIPHITPLDLYLLTLFPEMFITANRAVLMERLIYYTVLKRYVSDTELKSVFQ